MDIIPTDLYAEITSHLSLPDLKYLAGTAKKFSSPTLTYSQCCAYPSAEEIYSWILGIQKLLIDDPKRRRRESYEIFNHYLNSKRKVERFFDESIGYDIDEEEEITFSFERYTYPIECNISTLMIHYGAEMLTDSSQLKDARLVSDLNSMLLLIRILKRRTKCWIYLDINYCFAKLMLQSNPCLQGRGIWYIINTNEDAKREAFESLQNKPVISYDSQYSDLIDIIVKYKLIDNVN